MFQFPPLAPTYAGNPVLPGLGFPIRKSRGQTLVCQLTRAYRRLLRPSSPPNAKAFTVCPSIIHTKTINLRIDDEISLICRHCVYHHSYAQFKERNRPWWSLELRPESVVEKQTATTLIYQPCPFLRRVKDRLLKGGDPAAGSPTATLLRLHPNHRQDRRRILPEG